MSEKIEEKFNKPEISERERLGEEKKFMLIINSESLASEEHPKTNQDAFLVDKENEIFGVFDGLGGEAAGEVASKMAKDLIEERAKIITEALTSDEVKDYLREFLEIASEKIREDGYEHFERMNMGTTASLVKICRFKNELPQAVIANVGDSRVYLKKGTGEFRQITKDDSVVQELLDKKLISEKEALIHPKRNIVTEILGGISYGKPKISITTIEINPGDKILICTDGIHDNLTNEEIEKIFNEKNIINDNIARELVLQSRNIAKQGKTKNPRAKMDDMTAIVVEVVKEFYMGQKVKIKRSGKIENDWYISNFLPDGKIEVTKELEFGRLAKRSDILSQEISEEELKKIEKNKLRIAWFQGVADIIFDAKDYLKQKDEEILNEKLEKLIEEVHFTQDQQGKMTKELVEKGDALLMDLKECLQSIKENVS